MAKYRFKNQSGTVFVVKMTASEYHERVKDGKLRHSGETLRAIDGGPLAGVVSTNPSNYPMACESLAVDRENIAERVKEDARLGVGGTEYTRDGRPIMRDKSHYRAYRQAYRVHFRNSYYG